MENLRSFLFGPNKDATFTNNQQSAGQNLSTGRVASPGMSSGLQSNVSPHIGGVDTKTHYDAKRIDSDSYFYIMWRS